MSIEETASALAMSEFYIAQAVLLSFLTYSSPQTTRSMKGGCQTGFFHSTIPLTIEASRDVSPSVLAVASGAPLCGELVHRQCLLSRIQRRVTDVDFSDFAFQTTGSEGALLVMPDGALSEDMLNRKTVEKYIADFAKSWYEYVEGYRGISIENGDIRVVVGVDKVSSWGIATFENVKDPLRFEFKEDERRESQARTYKWDGIVAARAGPLVEETEDLLWESNSLRNQCVFVRTLNVFVAGKVWDELAAFKVHTSCFRDCHSDLAWDGSSSGQRNENFQTSQFGLTVSPSSLSSFSSQHFSTPRSHIHRSY